MGRSGGVSTGRYESLNLSYWVGDWMRDVDLNWQRARTLMAPRVAFAMLNQIHGNAVHTVTDSYSIARPDGDGMVTAASNLILCIFTADCVPILLADFRRPIVGALHAGWRGTLAGIALQGVAAMERLGASAADIEAVMGPSIGPCCYEVNSELADRFAQGFPDSSRHIRPGPPDKAYLDLCGFNADQLAAAGLKPDNIRSAGPCTRCTSESYFSRRAAGGATTGLQLSFIGLVG
ncbi:MAG TPA: peptidoglycan editing factor PgeF [Candidatus Binataceae bacterium]|nr:peptidoglycan editing factor PgeF [Candidatus Binataceae bacterium]